MSKNSVLYLFVLASVFVFITKLVMLQIANSSYLSLAVNNAVIELPTYPERGLIFDRTGKLLVANKPAYDLMVIPEQTEVFDTLALSRMLDLPVERLKKKITRAKTFSSKLASVLESQISVERFALLQETIWKYRGFYITRQSVRDYRLGIAGNLLGYVSEVTKRERQKDPYYALGDLIGRQGIEKTYEKLLRGKKGKRLFQKDRFNKRLNPYKEGTLDLPASNSSDITLTIEATLQAYGEELMQNKRGGIVAIEPSSGEVLALVSAPSYDSNLLIGRNKSLNYQMLANDSIAKPLFDRGLLAQYAPGSTFKLLNALVALQHKIINPKTTFYCNEGHYYAKKAFMECHCKKKGRRMLEEAIYRSCNTYFAKTYKQLIESEENPAASIEKWKLALNNFGLGNFLGYDLPIGQPGFIPGANHYNKLYGVNRWGATTTISNAIGQGEILTTPIQMANFIAAIANKGHYVTPHFLKEIDGKPIKHFERKSTDIDSVHFNVVINAMENTVKKGTARIAAIKGITVCGKTGTVENYVPIKGIITKLTDHSIFVGFAPKQNPKIAIAAYVENGYWGSRWAAPIASLMMEQYLTGKITRSWLDKRMKKGDLTKEYEKPYSGKPFTINE